MIKTRISTLEKNLGRKEKQQGELDWPAADRTTVVHSVHHRLLGTERRNFHATPAAR